MFLPFFFLLLFAVYAHRMHCMQVYAYSFCLVTSTTLVCSCYRAAANKHAAAANNYTIQNLLRILRVAITRSSLVLHFYRSRAGAPNTPRRGSHGAPSTSSKRYPCCRAVSGFMGGVKGPCGGPYSCSCVNRGPDGGPCSGAGPHRRPQGGP